MAKYNLMTHLVAGYPTMAESKKAAFAMAAGGSSYLEVQFPFSDPIADGPLIQGACTEAIDGGFTLNQGFDLIKELSDELDIPVFIMTYANLVIATGIEAFVEKAIRAGAAALIIPDLPYDYDEGLYEAGRKHSMPVVPVVIPGISENRLKSIMDMKPDYIYTAIRKGITGAKSAIDESTIMFLNSLSGSGIKILAGFGIRDRDQVELLAPHVHSVVVGSARGENIKKDSENRTDIAGDIKEFFSNLAG
jgi:tryptophan synthase alpha chain